MKKRNEKRYIKFVKQILRNLENLRIRKYSHKFSKKMYGNWVHIVLLALRQKIDKSYREFIDILEMCTEILNLLKIKKAPHFTTLQKAASRLRFSFVEKIMSGFILLTMTVNVRTGMDSTGLQPTRASSHYTKVISKDKKKRRKIRKYIKLSLFADLDKQLIISQKIRRGPANDNKDSRQIMKKGKEILGKAGKKAKSVDGDKGYDSEANHKFAVEELKAEDRIKIKNKDVPIHRTRGVYRKKAKRRINRLRANYRSKIETINFEGSTVRSIKVSMQNKETLFKLVAYNADRLTKVYKFINLYLEDFYRAGYSVNFL
ncbi:hypothetical protein HYX16_01845 [Candidatus Woesearchaeota archaeon]|nr:hypothetical protein [Candidatus Woesearchaeota archaeon]